MRFSILLALAAQVFGCVAYSAENEMGVPIEIYRKPLEGGSVITITRTAFPAESFRLLLKEPVKVLGRAYVNPDPQNARVNVILVELISPKSAPIILASMPQFEASSLPGGVHVLPIIAEPGRLVIPLTCGSALGLWEIRFDRVTIGSWTWLYGWQISENNTELDEKSVRVEISRQPDGRLNLAVTDLRPGDPFPTLYEQTDNDWHFTITKSWKTAVQERENARLGR